MRMYRPIILALMLAFSVKTLAAATDISNLPLTTLNSVKPNLIFALDDSGSMDYEVLLTTNDGALWWDGSRSGGVVRGFTDSSNGTPWFNTSGDTGEDNSGHTWYKYVYLFPNGYSSNGETRVFYDGIDGYYSELGGYGYFAIPPIPDYAYMRSPDYNPIYYNPTITYTPWEPAYISGSTRTFSDVNPSQAPSHPVYNSVKMNLTATLTSQTSNWTFRMLPGMTIPGALISGITGKRNLTGSWTNITTNYTIPSNSNEVWDVSIPYYPATYYLKDPTCTSSNTLLCPTAPDGKKLRRYEIKPGNTFPSGRTYTEEMQNFANWFSYHRKRKLMLADAMGSVLSQLNGLRGGVVKFNDLEPVTMYDFDSTTDSQNSKVLLGAIYSNPSWGFTPTRDALNYAGNQYRTNSSIIQYACQVNATLVLTDGFAYAFNTTAIPTYNSSTWGSGTPYTPIYTRSLADIALAYYTLNLRPSMTPAGVVPVNPNNASPSADRNPNLHMNTYALSLGMIGTIYGTGSPQANAPYQNPPAWPNPDVNASPTAIDDLWHATINGRGAMFTANNTSELITYLQNLIGQVFLNSSSSSAVSTPNVNISASNNTIYVSSYSAYAGDVQPYTINTTNGQITPTNTWSASSLLDQRTASNRAIATYNGVTGVPFQWINLLPTMQTALNNTISPPGPSDGPNVLAWLRGDRSREGTIYRARIHLLGDIVYSEPVPVSGAIASYTDTGYSAFSTSISNRTPMIYQGANDGMLHAFNASTGQEVWAYVPKLVFNNLRTLSSRSYSHLFYVDGTPTVGDVADSSNNWRTILVGGLRAGGKGYYALNITNPTVATDANAAAKVMWEFPNTATLATVVPNIGLSFGKPVIAKTKAAGWVVLVTSGYNNNTTGADGKGHLFVLNPITGALIADLVTTAGSTSTPSGLGQISAYAANTQYDATIDYVYGGDLQGNLWRFDLSGNTVGSWNVKLLATLVDSSGNRQPIMIAPELSNINNRRMVYVGTGQLLGTSDLSTTRVQSIYGLVDNMTSNPTITPLRSNLRQQTVSGNTISTNTVNYSQVKGWYLDLPGSGERATTDPVLVAGNLVFNTNQPSATACSTSSYEYVLDPSSGGQISGTSYNGAPAGRIPISSSFATKPLIVMLPNGRLISIIHTADNTIATVDLPSILNTGVAKKIGWKEVLRN